MLKLSKMTDYAVVVLAEMSGSNGAVLKTSDIALSTKLPEPTVSKVLKALVRNNLVTSSRGANGGYSLQKSPQDIDMASIVTALEGPIQLTSCVDEEDGSCDHAKHCNVKGKWNPVNAAMQSALQNVSLAQMIGPAR